jgi:non-homologous end joining protein Ku
MRAIWSGTISFGLVGVPVRMYSATESRELRFHFLHKDDLQPIGYGTRRESVEETKRGRTRRKTARKAS